MLRRMLLSTVVAAGCLALFGGSASAQESTIDAIKKRDEIQLLITNNFPFQYKKEGESEWRGFNIDIGNILAKELNVKPVYTEVTWATLLPSLIAKKGDIIFTAVTMTTARAQAAYFTQPASYTSNNIVLKKDDARFKSLADFNDDKVTFAVFPGAPETMARSLFPKAKIRSMTGENPQIPRLEVVAGRADASITDLDTAKLFVAANPTTKVWEGDPVVVSGNHWMVRLGEEHLVRFLDSFVQDIRNRGVLTGLGEKWKVRTSMN